MFQYQWKSLSEPFILIGFDWSTGIWKLHETSVTHSLPSQPYTYFCTRAQKYTILSHKVSILPVGVELILNSKRLGDKKPLLDMKKLEIRTSQLFLFLIILSCEANQIFFSKLHLEIRECSTKCSQGARSAWKTCDRQPSRHACVAVAYALGCIDFKRFSNFKFPSW